MRRCCIILLALGALLATGCSSLGTLLGIVSPDAFDSRYLRLRNNSAGYVVFRITAPGSPPVLTHVMPPGAVEYHEVLTDFGAICPESLHVDIAAYDRLHPEVSPLEDWSVRDLPYAAVAVDLLPVEHFGCSADVTWVSIDSVIECSVLDVDPTAGALGFQAGWISPQWQSGVQIADPPPASAPELFPLRGRVVNALGEPLAGVEVRLPQFDDSVVTDALGQFSVDLAAGVYLLEPALDGVEISPAVRAFTHANADEVPIEFIALTDTIPALAGSE